MPSLGRVTALHPTLGTQTLTASRNLAARPWKPKPLTPTHPPRTLQENSNTGDGSAGFAAIWTCLLCIAIGFGGTMVMRKFTSSLMVGFLLGVCSTMAQLQFLIFVVFLYYSDEAGSDSKSADQAASAFAFFLFIIFSLFSVVLFFYRNAIMINTSLAGQDSTATGSAAASPASTPTQAQSLAA
mmetsp:Transcript_1475/g.3932  ORF Transcript_1475/g.3932 Transcript_1475/m.3932 type:complete len:184 (+) Transcript_1475:1169-1720(+)